MLTIVISFLAGVLAGAVGAFLVARNNKAKAVRAIDMSDKYKDYMTKWYDDIKKEKKD